MDVEGANTSGSDIFAPLMVPIPQVPNSSSNSCTNTVTSNYLVDNSLALIHLSNNGTDGIQCANTNAKKIHQNNNTLIMRTGINNLYESNKLPSNDSLDTMQTITDGELDHTNKLMQINITFQLLIDLLLSSILAFVLNISNYLVLSVSFPITYQVLGHIKTIFIFAGGIIFYDQVPSSKAIFGIIVTLIGVILYSEDNRRQQQEIILFNKNGKNENNDNL
jgi:multidrug transporter EmrE-like cation transporter